MGLAGLLLARSRFKLASVLLIAAYGASGIDGLAHYTLALCSEHTLATNLTIWFEVLAGMALLLCAVTTDAQIQAPWALIVVPLVPFVASLACMAWIFAQHPLRPLVHLRSQARADLDMLRESSAP